MNIELPTAENPVVVIHGDCLDVLPHLPKGCVDAVVTDPPYGVELGGVGKEKRHDAKHLGKLAYESYDDTYENLKNEIIPRVSSALRISKRGAIFTGPHFQDYPKAATVGGVYHPSAIGRNRWGFTNFLPVLFYGAAPDLHNGSYPTVIRSTATSEETGHPCPKPLEWMTWLINRASLFGETILDPFAGSGTVGKAALMLGRRAILIEKDAKYVDICRRRIAEAMCRPVTLSDGRRVGQNLFAEVAV